VRRLLLSFVVVLVVGCRSRADSPPAENPETRSCVEPATAREEDAGAPEKTGVCALVSSLRILFPRGTRATFMIEPDEEPTEQTIEDFVIAGKSGRERIAAALSSVLDAQSASSLDITTRRDGSYRVHVRARRGEAATCHGREDELDLTGTAKLDGDSVAIDLVGTARVTEDVCRANGRGRDIVGRHRATATLRFEKRC
jgi:hypothetical protein